MPPIPDIIGKYKIVDRIASGGMGAVFKAEHPTLDRHIIIKKLTLRGNASVRERFLREARIMMDFNSDYIVGVYDHFREKSSHYIVLEYVDGVSVEGLLKKERYLPEEIALRIFADCCKALQYAHDRGVVHRDIKPGNILLSKDGLVKLVDFGIASIRDENDSLTREGMTLGTPSYMSPEQYLDSRSVDNRSDIYAMGVMLYEMTTGKKPFPGTMSPEAMRLIQQGKYPRPEKINPKLSLQTRTIIRKCMKVNPKRRYPNMELALLAALRIIGRSSSVDDRAAVASYLAGKKVRSEKKRRWRALLSISIPVFALLAAAAGLAYSKGYHHELFGRDHMSALELSVRVPRQEFHTDKALIRADIFEDDNDEIPPVDAKFLFRADPNQETADFYVFTADRLYLPSGSYRIKLAVASHLRWESFFIPPLSVQGTSRIYAEIPPSSKVKLDLQYQASDAITGESLLNGVEVSIRAAGKWLTIHEARRADLATGAVFRFRFSSRGYYREEYSLLVQPHQARLQLHPSLVPLPGELSISTEIDGIDLRIDGESEYVRGGPRLETVPIPEIIAGTTKLLMPPGTFELGVAGSGEDLVIDLRSGTRKAVSIVRGDGRRLEIRSGPETVDRSIGF